MTPNQNRCPASVTTKDGSRSRVMMMPWMAPIAAQTSSAAMMAAHHGQLWRSRGRGLGLDEQGGDDPADRRDIADRKVDLAEQQDEDLADRQDDEHRALVEQVDEVARREEDVVRAHDLEDDRDGDEGDHDGQDAGVAAP